MALRQRLGLESCWPLQRIPCIFRGTEAPFERGNLEGCTFENWKKRRAVACILQLLVTKVRFDMCQSFLTLAFPEPNRAEHLKMKILKDKHVALWFFRVKNLTQITECVRSSALSWFSHLSATLIFALTCTTSTVMSFWTVCASHENHMPRLIILYLTRGRHRARMCGCIGSWLVWCLLIFWAQCHSKSFSLPIRFRRHAHEVHGEAGSPWKVENWRTATPAVFPFSHKNNK